MSFNTPLFLLFFVVFFVLYSFVFLKRLPRLYLILVGSFVFYAGWNYRFIPLIIFSAVVDYYVAIAIVEAMKPSTKQRLLAISISANLGLLSIFKYADFASQSVADFLSLFGYQVSPPTLALVLPVGISFYTFQSMSYTIDVYRGVFMPCKGLLQFTAALAFFPQLVAGPILRARQILPQFERMPKPTWTGSKHGLVLITIGLTKKTLADLLAAPAAAVFDVDTATAAALSWVETFTGVLAFAGQIYGDFSGYSDMAIGIGLLLGFSIPMNFRLPYLALSPVEFWRRWHISLSTWLRDYLYISLGGKRKRRYLNIMITMVLGGLWHGAAWIFLVWGFYHGCLIIATHVLSASRFFQRFVHSENSWIKFAKWGMTVYTVLIGWIIFRAANIDSAIDLIMNLHQPGSLPVSSPNALLIAELTIAAVTVMHVIDYIEIRYGEQIESRSALLWPLLILLQFFCFSTGTPEHAFIYFQF
jgi:alginate O-acetyltransferase complex protein AlgI